MVDKDTQPVTQEQLARLYHARNEANKRMSQAMRAKDKAVIQLAKQEATNWNKAYDAAFKQYKKQQKKARRDQQRTTLIRWYLDQAEQAGAARSALQCDDPVLLLQHA